MPTEPFNQSTQAPAPAAGADPSAQPLSLEQKLLNAATEAEGVAAIFSPAVAAGIQTGVSVEPIISGLLKMFIGIFHKHAKKA